MEKDSPDYWGEHYDWDLGDGGNQTGGKLSLRLKLSDEISYAWRGYTRLTAPRVRVSILGLRVLYV